MEITSIRSIKLSKADSQETVNPTMVFVWDFKEKGRLFCPKLYARDVWQILFNFYREAGGNLNRMDNLLIDYPWLIEQFTSRKDFSTYWSFIKHGATVFTSYPDPFYDGVYKIEYVEPKVTITKVTNET